MVVSWIVVALVNRVTGQLSGPVLVGVIIS